ncbi:hypothetical protein N473_08540 [Pseudoalteromonas luteoviolacea CPMOR-1]|uniref:Uncharacterized protein n=1 Tax=Pseudoalteromonas luteoviolacea CPMOR-1 TaxID=1365248 RepID=A0A161YUX6_9GAMM|nr:hypothetical protein N473_08540 [Pseudoalteromonas luteoviolacea CPMOR-1]
MWPFSRSKVYIDGKNLAIFEAGQKKIVSISEITEVSYCWDLSLGFRDCLTFKCAAEQIVVGTLPRNIDSTLSVLNSQLKNGSLPHKLEDLIDEALLSDTVILWQKT